MKIGFCCRRHHKNCFPSCASLTVLFPPWQSRTFSEHLMDSVDIFQCDTSMKNDLKPLSFSENTLCKSLMRPSRTCLHRIHGEDYTDWDACPSERCLLETLHFSQRKAVEANFFFYYLVVDVFLFMIRISKYMSSLQKCSVPSTLIIKRSWGGS